MKVNQAAFCTVTALAVVTAASIGAAVTTASTVAAVAYGVLGIGSGAVSIASITAWLDPNSTSVANYFSNLKSHAGYAIAGTFQVVAQTFVQALVQGAANGITKRVGDAIGGRQEPQVIVIDDKRRAY